MTLTIHFTPQEEAWIQAQAVQQGLQPDEVIKRLVDERLPAPSEDADSTSLVPVIDAKNAAAIAYLDRKLKEEATDDPEEIRKAEEELAEFKRNMNANRAATGERLVFP